MKLNLGSAHQRFEGFTNIDFVPMDGVDFLWDLQIPLNYDPDSIEEIQALHLLEHLSIKSIPDVLKNWYQVLEEGGKLTLELPDLDACIEWYLRDGSYGSLEWIFGNQERKGQQHKWGWNKKRLTNALIQAGFEVKNIEYVGPETYQATEGPCIRVVATK